MTCGFGNHCRLFAALGVLGLVIPIAASWRNRDVIADPSRGLRARTDGTALQVQQWSPVEAPLGQFFHVQDFERVLRTGESSGSFEFGPIEVGMLELRLYLEPGSSCGPEWKLAWVPLTVTDPDLEAFCLSLEAFLNVHRLSGEVEPWQSGWRVVWRFPEPARKVRIALPACSRLRVAGWEAIVPQDPVSWTASAWQKRVWRLGGIVLAFTCAVLAAMILWPSAVTPRTLDGFVLVLTASSFLITVFLLPPFQGPDEPDHWRDALLRYRRNILQEPLLYNLPEITGFGRVRWRAEARVSPTLFRASAAEFTDIGERKYVNYAWYHSYPAVAVVAWCFPRVETVSEALVFYYLCRLLPGLIISSLLYWLWRRERVPAVVAAIFSLPYVQQQCTVVSTDTLANVAALAAGLSFVALRRCCLAPSTRSAESQPDSASPSRLSQPLPWYIGLWLTTLLAFLAKPPIYIFLFLLPLWATPWRRLRGWSAVLIGGLVLLSLAGLVTLLVWRAYSAMHQVHVAEQFREQLRFLMQEGGWRFFLKQPLPTALDIPQHLDNWFMPLGWVDTFFHPYHLGFLRVLIVTAIATDLLRALIRVKHWWSVRAGLRLAAVIVVGLILFVGTWVLTALTMYLAVTPPRHPFIYGMQVRYLFPCLLAWVWLPLTLRLSGNAPGHTPERESPSRQSVGEDELRRSQQPVPASNRDVVGNCEQGTWTGRVKRAVGVILPWLERLLSAGWAATMLVITAGRLVGLVGDLLARYW